MTGGGAFARMAPRSDMMKKLVFFSVLALLGGCTPRRLAVRETGRIFQRGAIAIYDEPDVEFARESLPAQLKTLESVLVSDPSNRGLLTLAAEGFASNAFLFLEDERPERAKLHYLRARDFALRALETRRDLRGLASADLDALDKLLPKIHKRDVAPLFWAAFAWGSWVNLSKDSSAAVAELPKAVALMRRALELDPDFNFAGPDLFFGVYYASRPAMLGGDVKKAAAHFQEARRRTGGRFLTTYVLEARYVGVGTQDPELFTGLLGKALEAPAGQLPKSRLADEVAKRKAAKLMEKQDDLF